MAATQVSYLPQREMYSNQLTIKTMFMKKVFGIVAALAITASLMAANTANFVIAVESPDNDNIYDELVMAESTDYTAAYENLRDAEKMADANNRC